MGQIPFDVFSSLSLATQNRRVASGTFRTLPYRVDTTPKKEDARPESRAFPGPADWSPNQKSAD